MAIKRIHFRVSKEYFIMIKLLLDSATKYAHLRKTSRRQATLRYHLLRTAVFNNIKETPHKHR